MKCANFVCLNEPSGMNGFKGQFCYQCLRSTTPPVFECQECGIAFTNTSVRLSRIPLTCSALCKNRRKWKLTGKKWRKENGKNKTCNNCKVKYHGKTKRSIFCSQKCCNDAGYKKTKCYKLYSGILNSIESSISKDICFKKI